MKKIILYESLAFNEKIVWFGLNVKTLINWAWKKKRQKGNVKLFFRDPEKGRVRFRESLQLVHNDATTCQLLSVLNDKREVDVFVVCASSEDGVGGSCSYRKAEEKRPPNSHDNVIKDESL